jgi:hypothetical protein
LRLKTLNKWLRLPENEKRKKNEGRYSGWRVWDPNIGGEPVQTKAYGRNRRQADTLAHYEAVLVLRI